MSVEGKVVAITGTSAGIGRELAEVFAARGAHVVGCARRAEKGRRVAERIATAGGDFTFVTADVTREEDCHRFVDAAVARHGRLDVLINNAGGTTFTPTESLTAAAWDEELRLNLSAPLFCSQRAVRHMRAAGTGGLLLHIASVQGVLAVAAAAAYNASKAGLIQLSNTLAVEFLDDGIRSNVIVMGGAPTASSAGAVREMSRLVRDGEPDPDMFLPTPLTGTPLHDVANAFIALAGDDAKAITGAAIAIDQAQTAGSLYSAAIRHALSGGWRPEPGPTA